MSLLYRNKNSGDNDRKGNDFRNVLKERAIDKEIESYKDFLDRWYNEYDTTNEYDYDDEHYYYNTKSDYIMIDNNLSHINGVLTF